MHSTSEADASGTILGAYTLSTPHVQLTALLSHRVQIEYPRCAVRRLGGGQRRAKHAVEAHRKVRDPEPPRVSRGRMYLRLGLESELVILFPQRSEFFDTDVAATQVRAG